MDKDLKDDLLTEDGDVETEDTLLDDDAEMVDSSLMGVDHDPFSDEDDE